MVPAHKFSMYNVEFFLIFVVTRPTNQAAYECLLGFRHCVRVSRLVMDFGERPSIYGRVTTRCIECVSTLNKNLREGYFNLGRHKSLLPRSSRVVGCICKNFIGGEWEGMERMWYLVLDSRRGRRCLLLLLLLLLLLQHSPVRRHLLLPFSPSSLQTAERLTLVSCRLHTTYCTRHSSVTNAIYHVSICRMFTFLRPFF